MSAARSLSSLLLTLPLLMLLGGPGPAQGVSTETFREVVTPVAQQCMSEIKGATQADFDAVIHREELKTHDGKCLQHCVYEKLGGMKNGKVVDVDKALAVLHRVYDGDLEKVTNGSAKVEYCGIKVIDSLQDDACEVANVVQKCFRELH